MHKRPRLFPLVAVAACAAAASAQDSFLTRWQDLRKAQPAGVTLSVSVPKTNWFLGETLPLKLSFTSSTPNDYRADTRIEDRAGRLNRAEEFVVDRAAFTEDPLQGQFAASGGMGGLSGGPIVLSEKPFAFERVLNDWVRFRRPGAYRVYIVSRRVGRNTDPAHPAGVELVSDIFTLEVVPAPAAWVKQQIAWAVGILDAPEKPFDQAVREERQRAGRTLRFLDSPQAAIELLKHLDGGQSLETFSLYAGVLGSPYRVQLLPLMEQRLTAPEQPVWDRYLNALVELWGLVAGGAPMPEYPKDEAGRKTWQDESKRRSDAAGRKRDEYISRLIASLGGKQPTARAVCLNTLLDLSQNIRPSPPWRQMVTGSLIAEFPNLPAEMQRQALEYRWSALKGPAMLPILREVYAHPPAQFDPPMQDTALRRLYELSPDEARKLILSEIRHPTKNLRFTTLAMLAERTLPELDPFFASELEAGRADDSLVTRYATGAILQTAENAYRRRNLTQCATPLVYYFLLHDPKFGETELRRSLSLGGMYPACYDLGFQFQQLGRWAMSPALEQLAIAYLKSPSVLIQRGAAEVLGKYGSSAAQGPLWQAMEAFHAAWRGREEQVKSMDQPNAQLERTLRIALAQGDDWSVDDRALSRLMTLCSTDWCRQEVTSWLSVAKSPAEISVQLMAEGFVFNVAQYSILTAEQMRRKVAEYPLGTVFRVAISGMEGVTPGMKEARQSAELAVRAAGQKLAQ